MATHSSILAWKIPWTEEPGGLQSIGLQRVGHDWHEHTPLSQPTPKRFIPASRDAVWGCFRRQTNRMPEFHSSFTVVVKTW